MGNIVEVIDEIYCDFCFFPIWHPGTGVVLECIDS